MSKNARAAHRTGSQRAIRRFALKLKATKVTFILVCAAASCAATGVASACARTDVDYYLEKGYTREQVAAICGDAPAPDGVRKRDYDAYDDAREEELRDDVHRRERDGNTAFLQSAVSAWDVAVTPRHLTYTRKLCLGAGRGPEVTARIKICPEVRYRVYFAGLKVHAQPRESAVPGTREIEVTGKVKRKLLHDFDEYPPATRRQLLGSYRARTREGGTAIPIRKDYPMQRAYQTLRAYANRASRAAS